jgi:uncharacterized membrane protein
VAKSQKKQDKQVKQHGERTVVLVVVVLVLVVVVLVLVWVVLVLVWVVLYSTSTSTGSGPVVEH